MTGHEFGIFLYGACCGAFLMLIGDIIDSRIKLKRKRR